MKNYYFIILSILIIIYIIHEVRKNHLNIRTSFGWFCAYLLMLVLSIFPYSIDWFAKLLNISYPPALLLTGCVVLLLIINFNFSKKLSEHQMKIIELEQELSLLRGKENTK